MTPLRGTVALEEMHHAAMPIAEHLQLDVLRVLDVFLQEDRRIAEGFLGFTLRRFDGIA